MWCCEQDRECGAVSRTECGAVSRTECGAVSRTENVVL